MPRISLALGLDIPLMQSTRADGGDDARIGRDRSGRAVLHALRDVELTLEPGDRTALLGTNGAGKTTLLRVMAGIYRPSVGTLRTEGVVASMIDPMLGLSPELFGRENVRLYLRSYGFSGADLACAEADVVETADIGPFLDMPVSGYSAGMVIRLGFALGTAVKPDILLLDEWLFTADAAFLDKALARLDRVLGKTGILVLSTHQTELARSICNREIRLEAGRVIADGPIESAARKRSGTGQA